MDTPKKIVFIEDDLRLADMVSTFLKSEGYDVVHVSEGKSAAPTIVSESPNLVLLDLMLPDVDGIEICRQVRPDYAGPIIMLTAKNDELTEISALNIGADDYITKPIRPHILKARIAAQLRRESRAQKAPTAIYESGELEINLEKYNVSLKGLDVLLTDAEFELLALLVKNAGIILSREEIFKAIKGVEYDGLDRSVDIRISSLRKKLGDEKEPYQYIKTVRSKGYLFVKENGQNS